jgi:DNA primase
MSLPPGFLDDLRTRISLSAVVGRKVVWDLRKSNQAKGDWWAPCPFHQEKTASFHVDDRKGFYFCFGCHAKGDALTFVKETENLPFMEAVEVLAREAGLPMPARDPRAAEKADRQKGLAEVVEEAVRFYRLQLKTMAAAEARAYLARRRLSEASQDRWEIGFAPDGRSALVQALTGKGIPLDQLVEAGLVIRPDDGGAPYDRFRGRIMFPIRDGRGRAISFGGRALDPGARAKYLNGPETPLFDKGRMLFNLGPAREATGKGQPLVVAEGYMDVIALADAGFTGAVAPLGTAVTEDQLRLMWRLSPEPVIALDGDAAGVRAAVRLIDLALPLLEAGQGLRLAMLPGGKDPDDLIRAEGAPAMQRVLDAAQPMVRLLWQRETEGQVFDSPERKAALDKRLRAVLARIADASLRSHYAEEMRRLRADLFGGERRPWPQRPIRGAVRGVPVLAPATATARASALAQPDSRAEEVHLESVLLATLAAHPGLVALFESELETLDLAGRDHAVLRDALLADPLALSGAARAVLEGLLQQPHVSSAPPVRNRQDADLARHCLSEGLAKLHARRAARREVAEGAEDLQGLADEGITWRLKQAAEAVGRSERSRLEDGVGDDGERAMSRALQAMIDGEVWVKKRRQ